MLDLPQTLQALTTGEVSEWRAFQITAETAFLSPEHRRAVDAEMAGTLAGVSDRETIATTHAMRRMSSRSIGGNRGVRAALAATAIRPVARRCRSTDGPEAG